MSVLGALSLANTVGRTRERDATPTASRPGVQRRRQTDESSAWQLDRPDANRRQSAVGGVVLGNDGIDGGTGTTTRRRQRPDNRLPLVRGYRQSVRSPPLPPPDTGTQPCALRRATSIACGARLAAATFDCRPTVHEQDVRRLANRLMPLAVGRPCMRAFSTEWRRSVSCALQSQSSNRPVSGWQAGGDWQSSGMNRNAMFRHTAYIQHTRYVTPRVQVPIVYRHAVGRVYLQNRIAPNALRLQYVTFVLSLSKTTVSLAMVHCACVAFGGRSAGRTLRVGSCSEPCSVCRGNRICHRSPGGPVR